MTCWYIWVAQNDKLWQNKPTTGIRLIVQGTKLHLQDWKEIYEDDTLSYSNRLRIIEKWEKSQAGWSKLNVDVATDVGGGIMGLGWVLRDEHGQFQATKCVPWNGVFSSHEAEAMSICEALSQLKAFKMDYIQIEPDALQVIHGLNTTRHNSSFELILLDVKDIINHFSYVFFSFAKRYANQIAYLLV